MAVPTISVLVDWDNNGNFTGPQDDITADVGGQDPDSTALTINREGSASFGSGGSSGGASIVVRNDTGKYSLDNGASVLAGRLLLGRPVWVTCVYSAVSYGLFAGYIEKIIPEPETRMATIVCHDAIERYGRLEANVADSTTRSLKDYRTAILDAVGESATRRDLAAEPEMPGYTGDRTASALDLLEEVNVSTLSRHFVRPGTAMPDWYYYTVRDRQYKLDSAVTVTLVDGNLTGLGGYELNSDTLVNSQQVMPSARVVASSPSVLWTHPGLPFSASAGQTRTFWAQFSDPVVGPTLAYSATNAPTVVFTPLTTAAKITITAGASATLVSALSVSGRPASTGDRVGVVGEDGASVTTYGRFAGSDIDASLLATTGQAQGPADHMVFRFKDPRKRPDIQMENLFPQLLQGDLYEPIALTFDRLAVVARRFEITSLSLSISADRNRWMAGWNLQEPPSQSVLSFFKVGGSAAEGVGGTGILAY